MSDSHRPERPGWLCTEDGEQWPCEIARKQLAEAFIGHEGALIEKMPWLQSAASTDLANRNPPAFTAGLCGGLKPSH